MAVWILEIGYGAAASYLSFIMVDLHGSSEMKLFAKIEDVVSRVRHWGLKGCVDFVADYFPKKIRAQKRRSFFLDNARRYPMQPRRGVTLIAEFSRQGSLNKVMRDLAFSLRDAGIPFQTLDLSELSNVPPEDVAGILTPREDFRLLKYGKIVTLVDNPVPEELHLDVFTVFFWEFDSGVRRGYPQIMSVRSVIGMSDFNVGNFRRERGALGNVFKILYPLRFEEKNVVDSVSMRSRYALKPTDFVVFFNFDLASSCIRKNPDGVIRAFAQAFKDDPSAYLLFKVQGSRTYPEKLKHLREMAENLGVGDRFIVETAYLPQVELYGLTMASDVYISLHRGEGFGLGIAEAMMLGKAVLVTDYSAPTEFCNQSNAILVPYRLVPPPAEMIDHAYYVDVCEWAEPDLDFAAKALRELRNNSGLRVSLGRQAQASIRAQFSTESFRRSINAYLDA